jgi:hypothetical protein
MITIFGVFSPPFGEKKLALFFIYNFIYLVVELARGEEGNELEGGHTDDDATADELGLIL